MDYIDQKAVALTHEAIESAAEYLKSKGWTWIADSMTSMMGWAKQAGQKSPEQKVADENAKEAKEAEKAEKAKKKAPETAEQEGLLKRFYDEFDECSAGFHDFAGMICIKDKCPKGFNSCGPWCATGD